MKNLATSILFLLLSTVAMAQAPQAINYQGVLRDGAGMPIANHLCSFRFSILQGSVSGITVYVETNTDTTNAYGLFQVVLGGGTMVSGNFSTIDWADGPYFLKVEYDTSGSREYVLLSTTQILSVPFALYSDNSGHSENADSSVHCIKCDTTNYSHRSDTALYAINATAKCLDTITGAGFYTISDTMFTVASTTYYAANVRFTPSYLEGLTSLEVYGRVYKNGVFFGFANFGAGVVLFNSTPLYYIKTTDCAIGDVITVKVLIEYQGCKKMFVFNRQL